MSLRKKLIIISIVSITLIAGIVFSIILFKPTKNSNSLAYSESQNLFLSKPNINANAYLEENNHSEESLKNLLFIAQGEMDLINYEMVTEGVASPRVVFKLKNQKVKGITQKQGHDYYHEIITYGPINQAWEIYIQGENNFIKTSRDVDPETLTAVYAASDVANYTTGDFKMLMGIGPSSLTPYVLNNYTVISAEIIDKNYYEIKVKYILEPDKAAYYHFRDVKHRSGSKEDPKFKYINLEIVFTNNFLVKEIKTNEEYKIFVGANTVVKNEVLYTFSFNDFIFLGPDRFQDFVHLAIRPIEPNERDGLFYLQNAFYGDLLTEEGITFVGDIQINEEHLPIVFNMSMQNNTLTATISDFLVIKNDDNTLYFKLNGSTGKIISEPEEDEDDIDINEAILYGATNNISVEKDDDKLKVFLKINEEITLTFNFVDEHFVNLTGAFNLYNQDIELDLVKGDDKIISDFDEARDYTLLLEDIKDIINYPYFNVELPQMEVLTQEGMSPVYISGLFDVSLTDGITADGQITILYNEEEFIVDVTVYDENIYLNYNDSLQFKLSITEAGGVVLLTSQDDETLDLIETMQNFNDFKVNEKLLNFIRNIEVLDADGNLSINLNLGEELGILNILFASQNDIKVTLPQNITLNVSKIDEVMVERVNEEDYVPFEAVTQIYNDIIAFVEADVYEFNLNTTVNENHLLLEGQLLNEDPNSFDVNLVYDTFDINLRKDQEDFYLTVGNYEFLFKDNGSLSLLVLIMLQNAGLANEDVANQVEDVLTNETNIPDYIASLKLKSIIDNVSITEEGLFIELDDILISLIEGEIIVQTGISDPESNQTTMIVKPIATYTIKETNPLIKINLTNRSPELIIKLLKLYLGTETLTVNLSNDLITLEITIEDIFNELKFSFVGSFTVLFKEVAFDGYYENEIVTLNMGNRTYTLTLSEFMVFLADKIKTSDFSGSDVTLDFIRAILESTTFNVKTGS